MQLTPITMSQYQAQTLARKYREAVNAARLKRRQEAIAKSSALESELSLMRSAITDQEREDAEFERAYAALARGSKLIDVTQAITHGGTDERNLPKLAICRADARECWLQVTRDRATFAPKQLSTWGQDWRRRDTFSIPRARLPADFGDRDERRRQGFPNDVTALVPIVPIALRPADLSQYWILWEAEWRPVAPVDPVLLKRVNATMFAVIAQWDLTPLEQRVLEGRLGRE
jgi:hypothetical protein